jgi:MSHA biogenesis protein MshK
MAASLNRILLTVASLGIVCPALALESLPDPTRPPNELFSTGVLAGKTKDHAQTSVHEDLQSIIISPRHRAAVINGERVELGEKVGDATLVEVRETSVVLQGASGKRIVNLFPGVQLLNEKGLPQ